MCNKILFLALGCGFACLLAARAPPPRALPLPLSTRAWPLANGDPCSIALNTAGINLTAHNGRHAAQKKLQRELRRVVAVLRPGRRGGLEKQSPPGGTPFALWVRLKWGFSPRERNYSSAPSAPEFEVLPHTAGQRRCAGNEGAKEGCVGRRQWATWIAGPQSSLRAVKRVRGPEGG